MKGFSFTKSLVAFVVIIAMCATMFTIPVAAASTSSHLVLGVGRSSALVEGSASVRKVDIADLETEPNAMFCTPIKEDGKVYVPFRFVLENMGCKVEWDSEENATTIKNSSGNLTVWTDGGILGAQQVVATKIIYDKNMFRIVPKNGNPEIKVAVGEAKTYFERTYLPVDVFEVLGYIVYWDKVHDIVHFMSNPNSSEFRKAYNDYYAEMNPEYKSAKAATFYNTLTKKTSFYEALESYVNLGTKYGNHLNNSLAIEVKDYLVISTAKEVDTKENIGTVKGWSRQFAYAGSQARKYLYYVDGEDRKMYRAEVSASGRIGGATKVELPKELENKGVSQIVVCNDRVFFIVYDYIPNGGYVYMAQVGNEKDTTVRVAHNSAWNIYISPDYKLYYTNMDNRCTLYSIDLKDSSILNTICNYPTLGVVGECALNCGIQSIAFDANDPSTYYFTDVDTGSLFEVVDGNITRELLKSNGYAMYNFLNLYTGNGSKTLYYIEYPNGWAKSYNSCKIMAYDLQTNEISTIYNSDTMLMEITIVGDSLYTVSGDYSELTRINLSSGGMSLKSYKAPKKK